MAFDSMSPPKKPKQRLDKKQVAYWRKEAKSAFKERQTLVTAWQAYAEIFDPLRATFFSHDISHLELLQTQVTSEPVVMRQDLALQIGSANRPRGEGWFSLITKDEHLMEVEAVKSWCDMATKRLRNVLYDADANFSEALRQSDNDFVTFGNAVVSYGYNDDYSGMLFKCLHLKDCAWRENSATKVNQMFRKMRMTLRQIKDLFGEEAMPKEWRDRLKDHGSEKQTLLVACVPKDMVEGYSCSSDASHVSVFMPEEQLDKEDGALLVTHHLVFPYHVRRWMRLSDSAYGFSPATTVALADGRMLNRTEVMIINGMERIVEPTLIVDDEAIMGEFGLMPGHAIYVDDSVLGQNRKHDVIRPVQSGEPRAGMEYKADVLRRMTVAFFQHLIKPYFPEREMTATETRERIDLYIREAAPLFEPMEAENAILMDGVFSIGMQQNLFGRVTMNGTVMDLPEELDGVGTEWDFDTPLKDAKRKREAAAFDSWAADANQIGAISQFYPQAIQVLQNDDLDTIWRARREGTGPVSWLRKPSNVQEIRDAEAQMQAKAQEQEQGMRAAEMASKANPENVKMLRDELDAGA